MALIVRQDVATDYVKPKTNTTPFKVTRQDKLSSNFVSNHVLHPQPTHTTPTPTNLQPQPQPNPNPPPHPTPKQFHGGPLLIRLTFGFAPMKSCHSMASDSLSSSCASADKQLIGFSPKSVGNSLRASTGLTKFGYIPVGSRRFLVFDSWSSSAHLQTNR